MVISNTTLPPADHEAFATIGQPEAASELEGASGGEGSSGEQASSLLVQGGSSSGARFSVRDVESGTESLRMVTNFYDMKPADVQESGLRTGYKLETWDGGRDAYLRLRLRPNPFIPSGRGPQYAGQCKAFTGLSCEANEVGTPEEFRTPWTCTYEGEEGEVGGDLSDEDYRRRCEMPCDRRLDCQSLCHCEEDCRDTTGGYCECAACTEEAVDPLTGQRTPFNFDATADADFAPLVRGDNLVGCPFYFCLLACLLACLLGIRAAFCLPAKVVGW